MKELLVKSENTTYNISFIDKVYDIKECLKSIKEENDNSLYMVCDSNVYNIYKVIIEDIIEELDIEYMVLESSEENKSIKSIEEIYSFLIAKVAKRDSIIISLGGGILGDLVGFAASTYMRGISYINIPTTLISQTDSSVGGKVGYNFKGLKNCIGAFYNPSEVIICTEFIKTLTRAHFLNGLGEIIKYSLIYDERFLCYIEENYVKILNCDTNILNKLVSKCLEIKKDVVQSDFKDLGLRNVLNFGHTVGHAIEVDSNYSIYHGEAVAIGILVAIKLSIKKFNLDDSIYTRLISIYDNIGLKKSYKINNIDGFMQAIKQDKKNDKYIRFVLLKDIGNYEIKVIVSEEELKLALTDSIEGDN